MILREDESTLLVITQPDHALLAAELMAEWQADGAPDATQRDTILLAVREHDNGWTDFDAEPLIDEATGTPLDFMQAPATLRREVWWRGIARMAETSSYAAALIAQHALTVSSRFREGHEWQTFFREIERWRNQLLAHSELPPATAIRQLERGYRTVYLGDLLSLVLCNGWTGESFHAEGYRIRLAGWTLSIEPDPYCRRRVAFRVRARRIPARRYRSNEDLREALARSSSEWIAGEAGGTG